MIDQRGPDGKRHHPEHQPGCYYSRMEDCCTLCAWRLILDALSRIGPDRFHRDEPVGTEVIVPTLRGTEDRDAVDLVSGEVTEIHEAERSRDSFAVRLDDGETLAITVERVD